MPTWSIPERYLWTHCRWTNSFFSHCGTERLFNFMKKRCLKYFRHVSSINWTMTILLPKAQTVHTSNLTPAYSCDWKVEIATVIIVLSDSSTVTIIVAPVQTRLQTCASIAIFPRTIFAHSIATNVGHVDLFVGELHESAIVGTCKKLVCDICLRTFE